MQPDVRQRDRADEVALRLVQQHAADLLRFARRFSYCADDAHDAYQRTLEILVRRMRTDPPFQLLSWTRTVLRREALAIRAERRQLVGAGDIDVDRFESRGVDDPAERIVAQERLHHAAEALQRLKPQEVTALVLRAEGLSYGEICSRTGWTYTRTNRAVTEGRRALLARLGAIESGAECDRWLPVLSAMADGEATAADLAAVRPHLRSCAACRATLRDCRAAPSHIAALVPVGLLPVAAAPAGSLLGQVEVALHGLAERATLLAARLQGGFEALPGGKLAAVAASTAALAGGGAALQHASHERPAAAPTRVATVAESDADERLVAIAAPFPAVSATTAPHTPRRATVRREFGRLPTSRSEFTPGAGPAAEFAASTARAPQEAPGSPAPASSPASASSAPSAPSDAATVAAPARATQSFEFGGP